MGDSDSVMKEEWWRHISTAAQEKLGVKNELVIEKYKFTNKYTWWKVETNLKLFSFF